MKPILILATYSSGSTYFQRAATFWIHQLIDSSITNPHDLLNGITYQNGHLVKEWMSVGNQSYTDIIRLLKASKSPYLARLSYDKVKENDRQFYNYLNNSCDIYVSVRDNLFDYGMCWAIRRCTNRDYKDQINNVHSAKDRARLYSSNLKFKVDPTLVIDQASKYLNYRKWVDDYFPNAKTIDYQDLEKNIDDVLMTFFPSKQTIQDKFGVSIARMALYQYLSSKDAVTKFTDIEINGCKEIIKIMDEMCQSKIMLDSIPVKSTTISDKLKLVENFDECVQVFNQWAINNKLENQLITKDWLEQYTQSEKLIYGETI